MTAFVFIMIPGFLATFRFITTPEVLCSTQCDITDSAWSPGQSLTTMIAVDAGKWSVDTVAVHCHVKVATSLSTDARHVSLRLFTHSFVRLPILLPTD